MAVFSGLVRMCSRRRSGLTAVTVPGSLVCRTGGGRGGASGSLLARIAALLVVLVTLEGAEDGRGDLAEVVELAGCEAVDDQAAHMPAVLGGCLLQCGEPFRGDLGVDGAGFAGVAFDQAEPAALPEDRELWSKALRMLRAELMPPKGKPRPTAGEQAHSAPRIQARKRDWCHTSHQDVEGMRKPTPPF